MRTTQAILQELSHEQVRVYSSRDFLHLGSEIQAHRALRDLVKAGELFLIDQGLYTTVVRGRFGAHAPSTKDLLMALETRNGIVIVPSCAAEANTLGLTPQVPVREIFLTSGIGCRLQLGRRSIDLMHARDWLLGKGNHGSVVRALYWSGEDRACESAKALCAKLTAGDWAVLEKDIQALRDAPTWIVKAIACAHPG